MNLNTIKTEQRNDRTMHIDRLSTLDMVKLINDEDKKVALAVETQLPQIAAAIDVIAARLKQGGGSSIPAAAPPAVWGFWTQWNARPPTQPIPARWSGCWLGAMALCSKR